MLSLRERQLGSGSLHPGKGWLVELPDADRFLPQLWRPGTPRVRPWKLAG